MNQHDILSRSLDASDPRLAEALVNQHYAEIYRLAYSILDDAAEADDATQETFLRALRHWQSFQPGSNLKSWLATIAVRYCRDRLRRRKARQRLESALQALHLAGPPHISVEQAVQSGEERQELWRAVEALDEKHRLPLLLRFVHEMSTSEIASALEVPEGTVHSRLHYAVHKLQGQLNAQMLE